MDSRIPQRPGGQFPWAAVFMAAYGVLLIALTFHEMRWDGYLFGAILILIGAAIVNGHVSLRRECDARGWWEKIEAAPLTIPFESKKSPLASFFNREEFIVDENGIAYRAQQTGFEISYAEIQGVHILQDGASLELRQSPTAYYTAGKWSRQLQWQFLDKPTRIALVRHLKAAAPHARFTAFADKIADGWWPRAVH